LHDCEKILPPPAAKLMAIYGNHFRERNLYRMALYAEYFPDSVILLLPAAKLSWSHFIEMV